MIEPPYLPVHVGFDALDELDHVDWSALTSAYGKGVVGDELYGNVQRSLALLRQDSNTALGEGLWSNVCHQGTVYEVTAFALPFLAAVAAGDVPSEVRMGVSTLIGDIAIGGSFVAPDGSHSGSFGDGVDIAIQQTMSRCDGYLAAIENADPRFRPLISAIRALTLDPSDENREALDDVIDPKD